MKKNLLGIFALLLAIGLSSYTVVSKSSSEDLIYWFDQSNHQFVGSSSSVNENPLDCYDIGDNCVKGYQRPSQPLIEPTGSADASFAKN